MFRRKPLALAVHAATAGFAALSTVPALSQEAQEDIPIEEIVVTGSHIQKANLVTSSPVTQLDSEQLDLTGMTRVEDVLGSMPQVYLDQSSGQSIEATGTATLSLRNLGNSRTLVLVNGKRLPIHSPSSSTSGPDLNFIPMQLVERIEILTGGASSTYGSDAVAGVVNFIMNDHFEGVRFDVQTSFYRHDNDGNPPAESTASAGVAVPSGTSTDGDIASYTLLVGGNLAEGRGNITAYASYRDIEAVTQDLRDYSTCANVVTTAGTLACGGSATNASGSFYFDFDGFTDIFHVEGNEFVPGLGTRFNFAAPSYYQRPDERYALGAFAHYALQENIELYSELMFMDDRTVAQIAPAGMFFSAFVDVNCDSPLLSDQQRATVGCTGPDDTFQTIFGRRNVEGGPRRSDIRHTTHRILAGLRGDINETWRYDASWQFAEVDYNNPNSNYTDTARMATALMVDPTTGDCIEDAARCVPWNVWQTGGVTPEATAYFGQVFIATGQTDQEVISALVQGSLGDYGVVSPFAENGIEAVFGYQYRAENLTLLFTDNARAGEVGGLGAALVNVDGGYDVNELFVEASIPLVEDAPFAEEVILDLGYRYSDYSPSGKTTDTYKVAGSWAFGPDVKLRASYQRAVRAPNIVDQFQPQGGGLFAMNEDPCDKENPGDATSIRGFTFEQCARSGVSQAVWDAGGPPSSPANQYNVLTGGSTLLDPETSDTYSFGLVLTPRMVEGLVVSIDWYDIDVQDAISEISPETTLLECIENNQFCDKVHRGINDSLWLGLATPTNGINALSQNIGFFRVKGIDVEGNYTFDVGDMGALSLNTQLGWMDSWEQEEYDGAGSVFCEGTYGGACGPPTVELRNRFQAIWDTPWDVTLNLGWRHIGEVEQEFTDLPPTTLDAQNYIDLSGSWTATEWLTIRGGINNLLDKEPPFVPQGVTARENGNTYPSAYDALGQYIFLAATVDMF